nr:hypothetical protein [Tanacetum cinerariifolium]
DENPIRTLGDYSKPSHEGYRNTIKLIAWNNVATSKRGRSTRGASSSREETIKERVRKFGLFDNRNHQMNYNNLVGRIIHSEDVVDWQFLSNKGLTQSFFNFINTDTFSGPYKPLHIGVTFRLGGVEREISLLEFGWRVGLYSESVLNRDPPPHVYMKTSLVKMGVIMELHEGECCWSATKGFIEVSKGDDEEGNGEGGNKGVRGSIDVYQNMSAGEMQSIKPNGWVNSMTDGEG